MRKPSFFPSHFCCWEAKYAAFAFVFSKKWNSSIPSRFWWILLWNEETFTASVLGKSLKSTTSTFREKWSILRWKKLHFTKICRKVGWMLKMFICCFFSWQLKFRRFFFYRSKLSLKKYFLLQFQLHRSILKILTSTKLKSLMAMVNQISKIYHWWPSFNYWLRWYSWYWELQVRNTMV